jgi:branched-chain amino acid transport system substrate-binding protein
VQASTKGFLEAFKAKFGADPLIYAPFTYDATMLIIGAMQAANSTEPEKYLPELAKIKYDGASGHIEFDEKGDRKDAEMTIFTMKNGTVAPVAIIKGGQAVKFEDFIKGGAAK